MGHDPTWTLTRKARNQKSVHHPVPEEALEVTREHIAQYQRFNELIHQSVEFNNPLCRARIRLQWNKKNFKFGAEARHGETLGAEASREIESLLGKELGGSSVDFEVLETAVRRIVLQLGANLISAKLNATGSDCQGSALRCR